MLNSISSDRRNTAPSIFTRGGGVDRGPESPGGGGERGAESTSGQSGRGVARLVGIQGLRKHASARNYRPSFGETSPKRLFSMTENERFGLVFANTGSINSGTGLAVFYLAP
jgi:hypothetical protein